MPNRLLSIDVAIRGSRMRYAVAKALHASDLLGVFHTDLFFSARYAQPLLSKFSRSLPSPVRRLLSRSDSELVDARVSSSNLIALFHWVTAARTTIPASESVRRSNERAADFCRSVVRYSSQMASRPSLFYGINGDSLEIFEWARSQGVGTVLEQTILPFRAQREILMQEGANANDHGFDYRLGGDLNEICAREEEEWKLADLIVTGSPFVRDALINLSVPGQKIRVVPYGVALDHGLERTQPRTVESQTCNKTRVLYVGALNARKGIRYLLAAAYSLKDKCIFTCIGSGTQNYLSHPAVLCGAARLFPPRPNSEIRQIMKDSDIFVFPSLIEGSALVTYEAIASGLPIITTANSGSLTKHEVNGFLIPTRDVDAIVDAVHSLRQKPDWLTRMSTNPESRAIQESTSLERYSERLIQTLRAHAT